MRQFSEIFAGYSKKYGRYIVHDGDVGSKRKGRAETVDGPLTPEAWARHLRGESPGIGTIPLDDNENCVYGAIDIDVYDGLDFKKLERDCAQLPMVVCKSKSEGAHLFMFFKSPVPAVLVQARLSEIAAALGFGRAEIFPKQTKRVGTDSGNWINLPYFGSTRKAILNGHDLEFQEFLELVDRRAVDEKWLKAFSMVKESVEGEDFADGPMCLQHLVRNGIPEGTRNATLFNVAIYFKRKYGPIDFEDKLTHFNATVLTNPIRNQELQAIIKSVKGKDYHYECSKEPLSQYCDRRMCQKRKYGVGSATDESTLILTNLVKVTTVPPMWRVDVFDGVHNATIQLDSIEDLLNPLKFKPRCAEILHRILPVTTQKKWDEVISSLMDTLKEEQAPRNASEKGQVAEHFCDFVNKYSVEADSNECLLQGAVLIRDAKVSFKSSNFYEHLKNAGMRTISTRKVWAYLRDFGMDKNQVYVKGKNVNVWSIDELKFTEMLDG